MNRILALDQSHTATGFCRAVETWAGQPMYEVGLLTPGLGMSEAALDFYYKWLIAELDSHDYALLVFEQYAFSPHNGTNSAELGGVLKAAAHRCRVPFRQIHTPTVKKWAIGPDAYNKGIPPKVRKDKVKFAAFRHFGEQITCDDEADAAWMCDIGYHLENGLCPELSYRRDVLAALRKPGVKARRPVTKATAPLTGIQGAPDGD